MVPYVLFFLFFFNLPLYAYIDPGTGSYIIQILMAAAITGIYFIKKKWVEIRQFFKKIRVTSGKREDGKKE